MLCFDGERVGSPPFETLAGQKHCHYEQGAGEGLLAERYCCTCPDTKKSVLSYEKCLLVSGVSLLYHVTMKKLITLLLACLFELAILGTVEILQR